MSAFAKTANYELKPAAIDFPELSTGNQFNQSTVDTVIIRFDYKQSALFHSFTFEVLDSVVDILLRDTAVKLSIDGYAYKDEGTDTICYFLSLNRAIFIQTYVIGRGVDSLRITSINAYGRRHQNFTNTDKNGFLINCRAELRLIYPPPPINPELFDRDEDGISDSKDKCPDVFGYKENGGCPDKGAVLVPFAINESALYAMTYYVLDSVIAVLKENPAFKISISGHAHLAEGVYSVCEKLAVERAEIVKQYLLSRMINPSRIVAVKSYGISRPLNPAKNPKQILKNIRAEILIIEK
jgi:outer membrane protein OmpA-like peptidoglycan-associated protein